MDIKQRVYIESRRGCDAACHFTYHRKGLAAMDLIENKKRIRLYRRRLPVLLLAVLCSAVIILGGTYAWFTSSDEVKNPFKANELSFSFKLVEVFSEPGTFNSGQTIIKEVTVQNTGTQAGVVRVLVLPEIMAENGTILEARAGATFTFEDELGADTLNVTDWADGGDGYYYYLGTLESGEATPPLFSHVTLTDGLPEEYENARMTIHVKVEAAETDKYRSSWWGVADDEEYFDNPPYPREWVDIDTALQTVPGS